MVTGCHDGDAVRSLGLPLRRYDIDPSASQSSFCVLGRSLAQFLQNATAMKQAYFCMHPTTFFQGHGNLNTGSATTNHVYF